MRTEDRIDTESFRKIGNAWKHPTTGEMRYYINDAWKYGGLELDFYNTGNICTSYYLGEKISHSKAGRMRNAVGKCWITEDGEVHVKPGYTEFPEFIERVRDGIRKALQEMIE